MQGSAQNGVTQRGACHSGLCKGLEQVVKMKTWAHEAVQPGGIIKWMSQVCVFVCLSLPCGLDLKRKRSRQGGAHGHCLCTTYWLAPSWFQEFCSSLCIISLCIITC